MIYCGIYSKFNFKIVNFSELNNLHDLKSLKKQISNRQDLYLNINWNYILIIYIW